MNSNERSNHNLGGIVKSVRDIMRKDAEDLFKEAIKLLNEECPSKHCEWCEGR